MKVTICFDDVKIIVPCVQNSVNNSSINNSVGGGGGGSGNNIASLKNYSKLNKNDEYINANLKVADVIENAIARYKKATAKVSLCFVSIFYRLMLD